MEKKTILITGSSKGIGRGLAHEFLKGGHQVILNGRNGKLLTQTLDEFKKEGFKVSAVQGDACLQDTYHDLVAHAMSTYGSIDIWINNAGIPQPQKYFYELDTANIESLVSVNITGTMLGSRTAIRFFREQGYGKLFNMEGFGSDGRMMDKLTLYGTSKRAIQYFSKSLAREVKEEAIQVGILGPGMVRTDFLAGDTAPEDEAEKARNERVFKILAEDVEPVTEFLVKGMLNSQKHYTRVQFLTARRLIPKLFRLMFVKK